MRPSAWIAVFVVLLASPFVAFGEDAPAAAVLPSNPFAKAQVGDWVAANVRRDMKKGKVTQVTHDYVTFQVVAAENGRVSVEIDAVSRRESGAQDANPKATFSADAKDLPSLAEYLRLLYYFEKGAPTVESVGKPEDSARQATGREFAARKLSWRGTGGERPEMRRQGALWFSDASRLGLVALVGVRRIGDVAEETSMRVVGFGSAGKTEWGKTMDEARVDEANKDLLQPAVAGEDRAVIDTDPDSGGK